MVQKTVSQSLYLAVNVTANPAPTMTWYRDNVVLTSGPVPLNGDTGVASLSIPSVKISDNGNYAAKLSNTAGSITYDIMVMVNGMLFIVLLFQHFCDHLHVHSIVRLYYSHL